MYKIILETAFEKRKYQISEYLPIEGSYLFIYEDGKCTYDFTQDSVEKCKLFAFEDFGVPLNSWREVDLNVF